MNDDYRYPGQELDLFRQALNWKRYIRRLLHPFLEGDVLEVGAGTGTNTVVLSSECVRSWDCLEPDPLLFAQLRRTISDLDPSGGIHALRGTLQDLPASSCWDVILYLDVLEHIEDDGKELDYAARRLRPGGCLIVLAPAHSWLFSAFDSRIGHFRRYTRSSLLAAAPSSLNTILIRYLDSAGLTASLANRIFLKKAMPTIADILFWDRFLVPCSRLLDSLLAFRVGKSLLIVWTPG